MGRREKPAMTVYKTEPYLKLRRPNPKHVQNEAERDALFSKQSIKTWLGNIVKDNWYKDVNVLHRFLLHRQGIGLTSDPDKLVEEVQKGTNDVRIEHLKILIAWLQNASEEMKYCETETRWAYFKTVKSFYRHNFVDLPTAAISFRSQTTDVQVETGVTANAYLDMVRQVLDSGKLSPRDRSIILTKVQGFMDNKTLMNVFNYVAFYQISQHFSTENYRLWDTSKCPVLIHLLRTKTSYPYFCFLDRDAIQALKEWLAVREMKFGPMKVSHTNPRNIPRSDPIYTTQYKDMRGLRSGYVTTLFNRIGKRTGVNSTPFDNLPKGKEAKRRYPFRAHEVRDTAITLARSAGVPKEVADFLCGHRLDILNYDHSPTNDPNHFQNQYKKLARYLNLVTGAKERIEAEYEKKLETRIAERDKKIDELMSEQSRQGRLLSLLMKDPAARDAIAKHLRDVPDPS